MSDPGTGKTRKFIEVIAADPEDARTLVLAPKSILVPAWGNDVLKFAPDLTWAIAQAPKRERAFESGAKIVITNHDAATWLKKNLHLLMGFHRLVIDESTAYKNGEAQRSKAIADIAWIFPNRALLSGTPTPNGILDIWHQMMILDGGERLGKQYYKFRSVTCEPTHKMTRRVIDKRTGTFKSVEINDWDEKPGATDAVSALIGDITIRNVMEECISIPPNHTYFVNFVPTQAHRTAYNELQETARLHLSQGDIQLNPTALTTKLLQVASGAVYTKDETYSLLATERYELILDLAEARSQCVIAFNWRHQRDELTALAAKRGIPFAVIDGSVKSEDRTRAVNDFQSGALRIIFAHPQSAGHGLTLTKGVATIWASPTYNLEQFEQFNHRIYRAGQTQKTETILVCAENTLETNVYEALKGKQDLMSNLLALIS